MRNVSLPTLCASVLAFALQAGTTAEFRLSGVSLDDVAIADMNGDGLPDVLAASSSSLRGYVFINTGAASPNKFSTGPVQIVADDPFCIAVGDLNGDGRNDLVFGNDGFFSRINVVLQTAAPGAAGTFQAAVPITTGTGPHSVVISDLNGDGKQDIAVSNQGATPPTVSVLIGNGNGTFAAKVDYPIPPDPLNRIAAGDINSDGQPDLVVSRSTGNAVSVLVNKGDGTYFPPFSVIVGDFQKFVALRDLNDDGKLDIGVALSNGNSSNNLAILFGNGNGTFLSPLIIPGTTNLRSFGSGDFTGDGRTDVVFAAGVGPTAPSIFGLQGLGNNTFNAVTDFQFFVNAVATSMAVGDLDNDGQLDVVTGATNPSPAGLYIERLNPRASTTALSPSSAIQAGAAFTLTVNGTGFLNGATVRWNGVNRTTTFVSSTQLTASIPAADLVTVGRATVTVVNPAPGGFASDPLFFAVFQTTAGVWVVSNTQDSGSGSLRFALDNVRNSETVTFDDAVFSLFNSDAATVINVLSELPPLDDGGVTVDASNHRVTVNGSGAGSSRGLNITSSSNTVRGLTLVGFARSAVALSGGAATNTIGGSRATGTGPNGQGLRIANCGTFGVEISGAGTDGNTVKGCWIGLDSSGLAAQANLAGVLISGGAKSNTIGGTGPGESNAIGGNSFEGVTFSDAGTDGNSVINNVIGAAAVATIAQVSTGLTRETRVSSRETDDIPRRAAIGNGSTGVFISKGTQGSSLGGITDGSSNTVANNGGNGLEIRTATSRRNASRGNRVGRNQKGGIALFDGSNDGILPPRDDSFAIVARVSTSRVRVRVQGAVSREGTVELFSDAGSQGSLFAVRSATANGRFDIEAEVNDGENVTATLTDADGNTSAFQVLGPGVDSDADGVSDVEEDLAGTSKNSASDVPVLGGVVTVDKAQAAVNFAKTGGDSVKLTLRIDLPAGYTPGAGTTVGVKFAGVSERLALVSKGASAKAAVTVKVKGSAGSVGTLTFSAKKDLRAALSQGGLVDATTPGAALSIPVAVSIDTGATKTLFNGSVNMLYKATQGKSGKAAVAK